MNVPRQRILVVEDDNALLEGVRDILELAGYEVLTATNGLEGLEILRRQTPDLILSDIMMPRMNGHEFYQAVRGHSEWLAIPFIFLTARGEKVDIRLGKRLGADDYVTKPFEEEDLLVAVGSKLKRRAELRTAHDQEMAQLKRTILTTLNHEFRTPLTYVTAYAEMLQEDSDNLSSEQFRDFLQGIQVGSERLRRLVEDFIFLVELEAGEIQTGFQRRRARMPGLDEVVREALQRCAGQAAQRGVSVQLIVDGALPPLLGDPDYLRDAVVRLVDNACKFSRRGEAVTLRVEADPPGSDPRWLRVVVSDQGIGIPPDELPRIFDLFYQIDRAKQEQQGSGSGLAIARGIAEMHGGRIEAASEVGAGSTFTLWLPSGG
jgi:signal transduction histidine kinase